METNLFKSINLIRRGNGANLNLFRYTAMVIMLLTLGVGNAWAGDSHDYESKLTVNGATGKGVVYADQVTNPSKVAYAYSSVSGPKTVTDKSDDHTYYAWVKACRGWSFDGWTASNTKSQTNSGNYYTVKVTPTKDGTKNASLTAKWQQQTAVQITYQVPAHGAYKVEYAYETYNEDSKSFVAANISSPNLTKNMSDASTAQTVDSYSGDIIKLTSTSGEFLGWYSSDDWADGHKLSGDNPYTYPVPASGPVSVYARYNYVETYYGKLNASVGTGSIPGGGKIYVSADAATGDITYSDATQNATKSSFGSGSQTYHLYAQPTDKRYTLRGWYMDAACTTPASVTKVGDHYEYTLTASSTSSGSPTEQTLYAGFEYNLYFLQVDVAPATPGLGMVLASKTSLGSAPQYDACSNESSVFTYALRSAGSANVYLYARGKYGYKFSGWYDNPECSGAAVGTANPFTYAAPASSADPQNPTLTTLYAKFVEGDKINVTYNNPDHMKGEYKAYALGIEEVDDEYMWVPTEIFTSVGKSANTVQSQYKTDVLILEADPVSDFGVTSWSDGGTTKTTPSQRYETTATTAKTVGVTFGDAMPFMVSAKTTDKTGTQYATLRDALNNLGSNKKITVVQNAYVPAGDYEIPSGVTLLVPHTADYTVLTMPDTLQKNASFSQYCRLTLEKDANITVNGALCVAGQQYATTSGNPGAGAPCGKYGAIDMSKGGHITVNSGANLYAFGFVFGGGDKPATGTITIKSGGTVYEDIIINDMHGGGGTAACVNGTSASNDYGLFPFSQYFIQNIEPKMTIEHGGKENVCFAIYSGFGDKVDKIDMIGNTDACLFQTTSAGSSVTKWYDYSRDYQCYEVTGTMKMNKISISAADIITMSSDKFVLPINNNMEIRMRRNATMTLPYDVKLLPGAKLIIDEGASMNVQKGLYVYDKQDWDKYACGEYAQVVKNIPGHTVRTVSSLDNFDNATIVVNGTLRLSSSAAFYTTSHGGSVISEGTGKIVFDVAGKSAGKSLYEVWGTYGKSSTGGGITAEQENPAVWPGQVQVGFYEMIVFVRIKGPYYIFGTPVATTPAKLRNEDGSYVATAGAAQNDQFIYNNDMGKWLKNPKIVTWDAHGGEVEPATTAHSQDAFLGELPMTTREGYTFNGWFTAASSGTKISASTKVTANVTYHAQWTPNVYNITYMDQGKAAFSSTHIDSPNAHPTTHTYGTATTLNGVNDKADALFGGWHTISNCKAESKVTSLGATDFTKDITLYAKWIPLYTLTVEATPAGYGTVSQASVADVPEGSAVTTSSNTLTVNGTTVTASPATQTAQYTYAFDHWNNVPATVAAAATIQAVFTRSTRSYNVTFNLKGHGSDIDGQTRGYGSKVDKPSDPSEDGYTFVGWYKEDACTNAWNFASDVVTGTTILYAKWKQNKVTVTWDATTNGGVAATPATTEVTPGEAVGALATTSKNGYTLAGWFTESTGGTEVTTEMIVSEAKTFYAQFTEITHEVTIAYMCNSTSIKDKGSVSGAGITTAKSVTAPAITGYTFANWTLTDGVTSPSTITNATISINATADSKTITANYTINTHKLEWDFDEGATSSSSYTPNNNALAFSSTITYPANNTMIKTGYIFAGWSSDATSMPDEDLTIKAQWTPNTNTPYAVKHFKQALDGSYAAEPDETDNLTGTTATNVTPDRKSYEGFTSPAGQEVSILADGSRVVIYKYTRNSNLLTWNLGGGKVTTAGTAAAIDETSPSGEVKYEALITAPEVEREGYNFISWNAEVAETMPAAAATYTAIWAKIVGPIEVGGADNAEKSETIDENTKATTTVVHADAVLTVEAGNTLTTNDLVLEASSSSSGQISASGQIAGAERVTAIDNVYFDLILNTDLRHWRAFTVPFEIDLKQHPILADGVSMPLGVQYDIVYYDGSIRAEQGKVPACWRYVEDDANWILTPGKAYMIVFGRHVDVVRFTKKDKVSIVWTGPVSVEENVSMTGNAVDGGWNGIGNPTTYHALLDAGVMECQVHNGEAIGSDGYTAYDMDGKFVVGKAVFVQVGANPSVVVNQADPAYPIIAEKSGAPRRSRAEIIAQRYDVQIAPADGDMADRIYLMTEEGKEDEYVILKDLAKAGISSVRAQMWIDRYGEKLCKNTTALINGKASYPLSIYAPAAGEYEISVNAGPADSEIYLTLDGRVIWNLSYSGYMANLEKGTTGRYGLRVVSSRVPTGLEDATIENGETIRKVMIEDKVYIIRNGEMYTVTGQLVK